MQLIRGLENFKKINKPLFIALGNFDGVHLGHQKIINDLYEKAKKNNALAVAFIFDPHPAQVLAPSKAPKLLVNSHCKADLLRKMNLDLLIYHSFNLEISRWSPEEFVKEILVDTLAAKEIYIGFNYNFGYKGEGDADLLKELGKQYGFSVNVIPPVMLEEQIISSSLVRQALQDGDIKLSRRMLGRHPYLEGKVISGESRGKKLGFPTANLYLDADLHIPGKGVYAAVAYSNGKKYKAVVNIGQKPTFHNEHPISLETHILNFDIDIYGETLRINFIEKIRDEKKFNSIDELIKEIKQDIITAEMIIEAKDIE